MAVFASVLKVGLFLQETVCLHTLMGSVYMSIIIVGLLLKEKKLLPYGSKFFPLRVVLNE